MEILRASKVEKEIKRKNLFRGFKLLKISIIVDIRVFLSEELLLIEQILFYKISVQFSITPLTDFY
jgi:hypothetical protein